MIVVVVDDVVNGSSEAEIETGDGGGGGSVEIDADGGSCDNGDGLDVVVYGSG